jgi:molybdopterin molybdotransferase
MMASPEPQQVLSRLAPLSEATARIDAVPPVAQREVDLNAAAGRVLAADVFVDAPVPPAPIALRDGWAVRADAVSDAGAYAPQPLVSPPPLLETGDPLPVDADTVLPPDAVTLRGGVAEATASAAPGEGVLAAGAHAEPGRALPRAGQHLRAIDLALLRAAGVARVGVRAPRLCVVTANAWIDAVDDTVSLFVCRDIEASGGVVDVVRTASDGPDTLARALTKEDADAVVVVGGTGSGRHDASVRTLARVGRVDMHGIGLVPGESAAIGAVRQVPVLMLPGRLDAALAVWLVLGRRLMRRLTACTDVEATTSGTLARKITSTVGLADVVLVRRGEEGIEPVASGVLTLQALAAAHGWVLVPPDREGYPPGATVQMRALP